MSLLALCQSRRGLLLSVQRPCLKNVCVDLDASEVSHALPILSSEFHSSFELFSRTRLAQNRRFAEKRQDPTANSNFEPTSLQKNTVFTAATTVTITRHQPRWYVQR